MIGYPSKGQTVLVIATLHRFKFRLSWSVNTKSGGCGGPICLHSFVLKSTAALIWDCASHAGTGFSAQEIRNSKMSRMYRKIYLPPTLMPPLFEEFTFVFLDGSSNKGVV